MRKCNYTSAKSDLVVTKTTACRRANKNAIIDNMAEIAPARGNPVKKFVRGVLERTHLRKPSRFQPHSVAYQGKTYPYGTVDTERTRKPTDYAGRYENMIDSGAIFERPSDNSFKQIISDIDHFFFDGSPTPIGWRNINVYTGNYLAPHHKNVIPLMDLLTAKMDGLYPKIKPTDLNRFVAWVCWSIIEIHPKRDGNGRLSKAVAEYFLPHKKLVGFNAPALQDAFKAFHYGMMEEVYNRSKAPWPLPVSSQKSSNSTAWLKGFFFHQGHDWVSDIIKETIKQTTIDQDGNFSTSVNLQKLALLENYLAAAPLRSTR